MSFKQELTHIRLYGCIGHLYLQFQKTKMRASSEQPGQCTTGLGAQLSQRIRLKNNGGQFLILPSKSHVHYRHTDTHAQTIKCKKQEKMGCHAESEMILINYPTIPQSVWTLIMCVPNTGHFPGRNYWLTGSCRLFKY